MILIKYSKLNGAEFIPHLDMLKHFTKIIRRMDLKVNYSKGFNPHALIYMSSPIALGLKTKSEYVLIDSAESVEGIKERFNLCAPKGIRCESAYETKKANIASDITFALYKISGFEKFNTDEVLQKTEFFVIDKNGNEREVRSKIIKLYFIGSDLYALLKFGNDTLRPDYLAEALQKTYASNHVNILKEEVFFLDGLSVEEYLEKVKCQ